jgi:excisionase family DNA binding protein
MTSSNPGMPRLLTVREAAEILNCSTKSVRRLIHRGILRRNPIFAHIRISREQVEAILRGETPI